jgi:endonuclease G
VVANPASGIKAVWVISGPIFNGDMPTTVGNGIGVPDACYKVIGWFDRGNRFNTRAYIVRQTDTDKRSTTYLTTVDAVEQATGLDFFSEAVDEIESRLQAQKHVDLWK